MKKFIKFAWDSGMWILLPIMIMIVLVAGLALLLSSPVGAFVYTLF